MISGPEAVARSARPFSECANDSGHYTYIIVISLTFVKCFLEKSSALPGQMGAKFRQNEEDAEGKRNWRDLCESRRAIRKNSGGKKQKFAELQAAS
jgi:hypothetical protein